MTAYLAGLPQGIESWPDHRAKASLIRAALRVLPLTPEMLEGAPPRLQEIVQRPPIDSAWITEVEYCAFALLVADAHGLDSTGFGRFWYDVMCGLTRSRLYAVLLRWISAQQLLRTTAGRWGTFHRGMTLEARATDDGLELDIRFPRGLMPELCIQGYTHVWQALIDHSSSRGAVARLVTIEDCRARYHCDGFR